MNRQEVLARREAAQAALEGARSDHTKAVDAATKAPHDANAQRKVQETATAYERAQQAYIPAHNAYMSLPEETFSWRSGGQAKSAVIERIALEEQLSAARTRALTLAADRRARQRAGDQRGVTAAVRQSREELATIRQLRAQLVQLTSREAKLVGGRLDRRDVPLTPAEIRNAPRAPDLDPSDAGGPGRRPARPMESTPVGPALVKVGGANRSGASGGVPVTTPPVGQAAAKGSRPSSTWQR
jgi:hypothetical protein